MDICPPEIHALICSYACTDDGTTGLSLSQVSRYIRQVSSPFQWQCLAISGIPQARAFMRTLRGTADAEHRPIYHLFLSTRTPGGADDVTDGWPLVPMEEWVAWPPLQSAILHHAAPTLQTLTLASFDTVQHSAFCIADLFRIPLPQLAELTIRGRCTPAQLACAVHTAADTPGSPSNSDADRKLDAFGPCTRPNLRRLHLACSYHGFAYGTKATHELVQLLSPGPTHLRISMLDKWGSRRVAEVLHAECAERGIVSALLDLPALRTLPARQVPRTAVAKRVAWPRVLPEGVHEFVIQPPPTSATNFYCSCCMDLQGDRDVMRVFVAMARDADERFLYLPAKDKYGYGYAEAKSDWLERIEEGGGCWKEKTSVEAVAEGSGQDELCGRQKTQQGGGGAGRGGEEKRSNVGTRIVWPSRNDEEGRRT
ncbi:hypothetical protein B0H21DRAFT_778444 [Amylocystis lapponica]|nr:hypothetical protein B0H21DRAFT_778444 [Amylocystis lapponica]